MNAISLLGLFPFPFRARMEAVALERKRCRYHHQRLLLFLNFFPHIVRSLLVALPFTRRLQASTSVAAFLGSGPAGIREGGDFGGCRTHGRLIFGGNHCHYHWHWYFLAKPRLFSHWSIKVLAVRFMFEGDSLWIGRRPGNFRPGQSPGETGENCGRLVACFG